MMGGANAWVTICNKNRPACHEHEMWNPSVQLNGFGGKVQSQPNLEHLHEKRLLLSTLHELIERKLLIFLAVSASRWDDSVPCPRKTNMHTLASSEHYAMLGSGKAFH